MSLYPRGAISSIEELLEHADEDLYRVSRVHSSKDASGPYAKVHFTGVIGAKVHPEIYPGEPKAQRNFQYFAVKREHGTSQESLLDMHVLDQDYNDWYLFADIDDAQDYLDGFDDLEEDPELEDLFDAAEDLLDELEEIVDMIEVKISYKKMDDIEAETQDFIDEILWDFHRHR